MESASKTAIKMNHKRVCVWHLMDALRGMSDTAVYRTLEDANTDMDGLGVRIDTRLSQEEKAPAEQQQPLIGRRVERAFLLAGEVADRLARKTITPKFILIGLLDDEEIRDTLIEFDSDLTQVRGALESATGAGYRDGEASLSQFEALGQYTRPYC